MLDEETADEQNIHGFRSSATHPISATISKRNVYTHVCMHGGQLPHVDSHRSSRDAAAVEVCRSSPAYKSTCLRIDTKKQRPQSISDN